MLLSGTKISKILLAKYKEKIAHLPRPPQLAVILVGDHPASRTYVAMKEKACRETGILSPLHSLPVTLSQHELLAQISALNDDPLVDGILVQLPLPPHIDVARIMQHIDPAKDIDGFHPTNLGKLLMGDDSGFVPCTPLGIQMLLKESDIDPTGQHVVIVGRSLIVGKPLAALLMQKSPYANATVTVAHSNSKDLTSLMLSADILIAALGHPQFIKAVKPNAVVIDVGITRVDGRLVGDIDFERVAPKCRAITPVPGGVGPMTVAMLIHNTCLSCERRLIT